MLKVPGIPLRITQRFVVGETVGPDDQPCWIWTGARRGPYGVAYWNGRVEGVHRIMAGAADHDGDVDHLCSVQLCGRPSHLEAVTQQENLRRTRDRGRFSHYRWGAALCGNGLHPWPASARVKRGGQRYCIECRRERKRARLHEHPERT